MVSKYPKLFKRKTKIICTIGPATGSSAVIERLIMAGMNIARFNLSHGTKREHTHYIKIINRISQRLNRKVAIMIDLPGPKYRVGKFKNGQATIKQGDRIVITTRHIKGNEILIPVNLPNLARDVRAGDTILLDDGAIQLKALKTDNTEIKCLVTVGGSLTNGRGLVVPGMRTSVPFITSSFKKNILFAINQKPDYLALSFVSKSKDIAETKAILHKEGADIPIIAKIERREAIDQFDSILDISDGIMVARGDLGVDIPLQRVPLVQKDTIRKCNQKGKPVITATQMLESMVTSARPTRAEVADVANAIFDGTDAIMLSAETSIGRYPVPALTIMAKIAQETENKLPYEQLLSERSRWLEQKTDDLISYNACHTAQNLKVAAIVAFTQSGSTAGRVSKYRPNTTTLALTPSHTISGRMLLYWGINPFEIPNPSSVDELFATAIRITKKLGLAKQGDLIVITGGVPIGIAGSTNLLKVERIS